MNINKKKEYGDYQTPLDFASKVVEYVASVLDINPDIVIEPTCGIGNFLEACSNTFKNTKLIGIDINQNYIDEINKRADYKNIKLYCNSVFDFNFRHIRDRNVLVIGNPPWITNSSLSKISSTNIPTKSNIKKLRGLEAITGASNFDICESIFLKIIESFINTDTTIALLCKASVARNIFIYMKIKNINFSFARMLLFDSKKIFNVSVEACLFVIKLSSNQSHINHYDIYDFDTSFKKYTVLFTNNCNLKKESNGIDFDGVCSFEWRQGVKHDCTSVMELSKDVDGNFINGFGNTVNIEEELVFPLVKGSHIKSENITTVKKWVIITQRYIGEDTRYIEKKYPKTWHYISSYISYFNKRKSSIYNNSQAFSIFGIGSYSFSKYKVAISGFYKNPLFSLIVSKKPVMLDDTCYFLSFNNYNDAYVVMKLLNNSLVKDFLKDISFIDAKRPFTKKILSRLDFDKILKYIPIEEKISHNFNIKNSQYSLF